MNTMTVIDHARVRVEGVDYLAYGTLTIGATLAECSFAPSSAWQGTSPDGKPISVRRNSKLGQTITALAAHDVFARRQSSYDFDGPWDDEAENVLECTQDVALADGRQFMVAGCYRMGEGDQPSTFEIYSVHPSRFQATRPANTVVTGTDLGELALAQLDAIYRHGQAI